MAESPIFSSQSSEYERLHILQEQENVPPAIPRSKRPPTVTPKRFKKFFTPRVGKQSKAARQLRDITKNGGNRRYHVNNETRPVKRRRLSSDLASSPPRSSPLKQMQTTDEIKVFQDAPASPTFSIEEELDDIDEELEPFPQPIRRVRQSGNNQRILQRSFGGFAALSRGRRWHDHCADWRSESADFVSTPSDVHGFASSALPFCAASCDTNSLIAIGEEEGGVRLIDTCVSSDFTTAHVAFRPHHNAIMDIAFSSDDYTLATASGDQTARIIDMHMQKTICVLSGHKSSLKQIRFQPNDDNMVTTSSRDGSVLLWDMRCGLKGSVASLRTSFARNVDNGDLEPAVRYSKYTLDAGNAHRVTRPGNVRSQAHESYDSAGVSITAIEHLTNGREHILLTSSEINSSVKLWDLRNVGRRSSNALLSSIPAPESHSKTRNYGINAMTLSGDGGRLYTACRDGTVYAYSTNHLVLGHVPEMSSAPNAKSRILKAPKPGLGPLYGFKHPSLRVGTFYVRASLRPAKGGTGEMLALGSSDNCAVLFPTDERHLPQWDQTGVPMYEHGTALIRGHNKEVTSLTWSHDGELVTLADDFTARCWRTNGEEARRLRGCGESGGQRWGCGWADVEAAYDEDDC